MFYYFLVKSFQLTSDSILIYFFHLRGGISLLKEIFAFNLAIIIFGILILLLEKEKNKTAQLSSLLLIGIAICYSLINKHFAVVFLSAISFFALIVVETETLHLLITRKHLSPLIISTTSLIPVAIFYLVDKFVFQLPNLSKNITVFFYIAAFIFSFFGTQLPFCQKFSLSGKKKIPVYVILAGPLYTGFAFTIYYLSFCKSAVNTSNQSLLLGLITAFYSVGTLLMYLGLNQWILKEETKFKKNSFKKS